MLLPDDVDRVLYLDAGDTLIIGDIEPYYQCDFQDKSLVVTGTKYKESEGKAELFDLEDLGGQEEELPKILKGFFNSGSYMMNLDKMRKDGVKLKDYLDLSKGLINIYGEDNHKIYWGDQGLLSAAFVGDVQYYAFPHIRNVWYMPYNFGLWYYNIMFLPPDFSPAILHYTGMEFKPWDGTYPIFLKRFQKKERLRSMTELKINQVGYFYLWHEYAIMTNTVLEQIGF